MDDADLEHEAVSQLIIERFVEYRLPYILQMKEEVSEGKRLTDGEIELLSRILKRAEQFRKLAHEFPEYQTLIAQSIDVYHEITETALRNEQAAN